MNLYKTIDDFNFTKKSVLLRIDINTEIINKKIVFSDRIIAHSRTIKELLKKGARIVILAHQGRPGEEDFISLSQHAKLLNKFIKLKFITDTIGKKAIEAIKKLNYGECLLLENIRFLKDEYNPSINNEIVKTLAPYFDYYINDSFSVAHRNETSIVSFAKVLPSCIGRVMEEELENIKRIKIKNCLYILGGSKPEDNLLLLKKGNKVLTAGTFALLCLIAKGKKLGLQEKLLKDKLKYISNIKKHSKSLYLPIDFGVKINGKRKDLDINDFPSKYPILDIGNKTIKEYTKLILNSKSIFLKGAAGVYEEKQFSKGTRAILKAIEKSSAFSVISGGSINNAIRRFKINKNKIGYISLSGGALVHYLSGQKLPGLEVLKNG